MRKSSLSKHSWAQILFFFYLVSFGEKVRFSFIYDSNPFLLSDSQINEFLLGKDMGFKTYDDLIFKINLRVFSHKIKENLIRVSLLSNLYYQSPIKSYGVGNLQVKRFFGKIDRYVEMNYKFIPYYLIRPIKKEGRFIPLSYLAHSFTSGFNFCRTCLSLGFSYEDYQSDFDFYDSQIYSFALQTETPFPKGKVFFGLNANLLNAKGEVPDISYYGIGLELGLELPIGFRVSLPGEKRNFTTKIDPKNRNRTDLIYEINLSFERKIGKKTSLFGTLRHQRRETTAEITEISEVKDYKRYLWTIGVKYE